MSSSQPPQCLLTIALPTFNRASYLKRCLASIRSCVSGLQSDVEILVSDNGSTDETPDVIESIGAAGLPIRYLRHPENRGPDWNILQCYALARGPYVWVVGDDDILLKDSVEAVLDLIRHRRVGMISVGVSPFRDDAELAGGPARPREIEALLINDAYQYITLVNFPIVFITSSIVNKSAVHVTNLERFIGTNLVQLGWLLPAVTSGLPNAYIPTRLVGGRIENTGGYGMCTVFGRNLDRILTDLWGDPAQVPLANVLRHRAVLTFFPDHLLRARRQEGRFDKESGFKMLCDIYAGNLWFWLFTVPSLFLPITVAQLYYESSHLLARICGAVRGVLPGRKHMNNALSGRSVTIQLYEQNVRERMG